MPTAAVFRTRFAPSPSGFLHLGNARTALFNWLAARANGGVMLLRIEDTDAERSNEIHIAAIQEDLAWLGMDWQGEQQGRPWRQSALAAQHAQALASLLRQERAYPCFCSAAQLQAEREEQLRSGRPPRYSGLCAVLSATTAQARLNQGEAAAMRFRMPPTTITFDDTVRGRVSFVGADIGDFVLRRANGGFSFFFANAVDDAKSGITLVLRGEDHLANTPRQLALLAALALPAPQYGHLPLMTAAGGGLLAKRGGALSVRELREAGFLPLAMVNYLARIGCAIADNSLLRQDALAAAFRLSAISKSPAAFDPAQLRHRQQETIQQLSAKSHAAWLAPALPALAETAAFCAAVRENVVLYEDAQCWEQIISAAQLKITAAAQQAINEAGGDFYQAATAAVREDMEWRPFCLRIGETTGRRGRALFLPLRAALTGRTDGPEMPGIFKLIGKTRAEMRLRENTGG